LCSDLGEIRGFDVIEKEKGERGENMNE